MDFKVIGPDPGSSSATKIETVGPIMGMNEEQFITLARSVIVMIPHRRGTGITAGLAQNIGYWSRFSTAVCTIEDDFGGFVEMTRAGMVRTFLQYCRDRPEVEYCVMIDADENVPWDAPYRLAAWQIPVVSGVICSFTEGRGIFACFTMKDEYGVARFPSWNFTGKMPGKGLVKAHSAGTGLLCVKKAVFEKILASGETPFAIPEEQRRHCLETGVLKWGEDISFCRQCERHGFDINVDLSVRGVHYKTLAIQWPMDSIDYDLDPETWQVDSREFHVG